MLNSIDLRIFYMGVNMARTWKIMFTLSLIVNCFFAWKIFYPHSPDDTARMYYKQSVINLRFAVESLEEARSSKEDNVYNRIHLANQYIHEALFDMKYYEDIFNRRGIQATSLSAELYSRWRELSELESSMIGGKRDGGNIEYLIENLSYWSKNLPDTYTRQTVGQIKKTMNKVSELKSTNGL
jgi:hypothetical protein